MFNIMVSQPPEACKAISSGRQVFISLKGRVNLKPPFVVYIYCQKRGGETCFGLSQKHVGNGKVIGEFDCPVIYEYCDYEGTRSLLKISNLRIYDIPRPITKFHRPCVNNGVCERCIYNVRTIPPDEEEYALYHNHHYDFYEDICVNYLDKPPITWRRIGEQND